MTRNFLLTTALPARQWLKQRGHEISLLWKSERVVVAHHGMQRSGTNYLCALLERSGCYVLNKVDPPRHSPKHKHCRWQDNKSTIVMDARYSNDYEVEDVDGINRRCGYELGQKHIVIYKNPRDWLGSIYRWGLANAWFPIEADFLGERHLAQAYLQEWDEYYCKWLSICEKSPSRVLILNYEELASSPLEQNSVIRSFLGQEDVGAWTPGAIEKVPHSKPVSSSAQQGPHFSGDPRLDDLLSRLKFSPQKAPAPIG